MQNSLFKTLVNEVVVIKFQSILNWYYKDSSYPQIILCHPIKIPVIFFPEVWKRHQSSPGRRDQQ